MLTSLTDMMLLTTTQRATVTIITTITSNRQLTTHAYCSVAELVMTKRANISDELRATGVRCRSGLSLELLLNKRLASLRLVWAMSYCSCLDYGPLPCQLKCSHIPCKLDRTSSRSSLLQERLSVLPSRSPCSCAHAFAIVGLLQAPPVLCGSYCLFWGPLHVIVSQDHRGFVPGKMMCIIRLVCHMAHTQQRAGVVM
jgi:hypothetical protein